MKHLPAILSALTLTLVLTTAACSDRSAGSEAGAWRGTISQEGRITVVRNPKTPIHEGPALTLAEDWTAGKTGPDESVLSSPEALAVDDGGAVFVLDFKPPFIKIYDAEGRFLRAFGRKGQGPGEIQFARRLCLPVRSDRLAVIDIIGKRLSWFDPEGRFLESAVMPMPSLTYMGMMDAKGRLYWPESDRQTGRERLVLFDPGAEAKIPIHDWTEPAFAPNPFRPRMLWEPDTAGNLVFGDPVAYELLVFNAEGALVRKIRREYDPLPVSPDDIEEFERRPTPPGISHESNVYSKTHGAFRSLFTDDLGHIFVQTWERTPDRRLDIHDVFDAEGRFIGRVPLPPHQDLINPTIRILKNGKLYAIEPDDEGYEVIKRYSVTWLID